MKKPTAIDLFSGGGGLTQGLKWAGFKVIGAVEINSLAVKTYKANHKRIKVWDKDIRELTADSVREYLGVKTGDLDLLAGCPPCQGYSTVRTRNQRHAVEDDRNDLIFDFLRFVRGLEPKTVMMENVPRLKDDERFSRFCAGLEHMGYKCNFDVLDTADYSVPQRRHRLILLASRSGRIEFAPKDIKRRTVRHTIARLPEAGGSNDPLHDLGEKRSAKVMEMIRSIPRDGGSRMDLGPDRQLECHKNCDGFKDIYGRMKWDDVAPTLTGGCVNPSKGRFLHPELDRAITLREAALLQTFPKGYYFSLDGGKHAAAELIGNALPPEFIKRHAEAIKRTLI